MYRTNGCWVSIVVSSGNLGGLAARSVRADIDLASTAGPIANPYSHVESSRFDLCRKRFKASA